MIKYIYADLIHIAHIFQNNYLKNRVVLNNMAFGF